MAEPANEQLVQPSDADQIEQDEQQHSFMSAIVQEIIQSPINLALIAIIALLLYKILKSRSTVDGPVQAGPPELPKLRRDFTVKELRQYDGTQQPDGRVLVAVNGNIYDVTKRKDFYGPGGPYAAFGGCDATRGLATFSVSSPNSDEYDDLSDLNTVEMESVLEWEIQFKEKYPLVGRLLKPGEQPTNYSDEDEDSPSEMATAVPSAKPIGDKAKDE